MTKQISLRRYLAATNNLEGWCSVCEDFTAEQVESDAHDRRCPVCERALTVSGAEQALLSGRFELSEEAP